MDIGLLKNAKCKKKNVGYPLRSELHLESNLKIEIKFPSLCVGGLANSILSCWWPCRAILCCAHVITSSTIIGSTFELNLKFLDLISENLLSILLSGLE